MSSVEKGNNTHKSGKGNCFTIFRQLSRMGFDCRYQLNDRYRSLDIDRFKPTQIKLKNKIFFHNIVHSMNTSHVPFFNPVLGLVSPISNFDR